MKNNYLLITAFSLIFLFACNKENAVCYSTLSTNVSNKTLALLSEDFETGSKGSYTSANVILASGLWNFSDALIGNSTSDAKNALQSARVRNSGKLTMQFDYTGGASSVTVKHAKYGSDANGTWQLWYSTNSGASYTQAGATISTLNTALQTATFTINVSGNIRFDIRKTDAGTNRINFDDFIINDYIGTSNPVPVLTTISPASAMAGGGSFTLTVNGSNFISTSVINWNGVTLSTAFVNSAQLTATITAASIATAGTASVTVFNPTPGGGTSAISSFIITNPTSGGKKFLFDATKAETAGNADWAIDENSNVPPRYPTPLQATITSTTTDKFWTGAISSWGIALVKTGNTVETLPSGKAITYGNATNTQDLSNYNVFVVDEPNTVFTASEKTAILNFVNNGGGLFMIADHNLSDRNNDGWDSPAIWNDLMTNNTVQNNPFGFSIDLTDISQVSGNVLFNKTSTTILSGSQGTVSQLEFNNGATITINPAANANVTGLVWQNSYSQTNTNIMCASSGYGLGRVFVVTDSSPMDDGTGAMGNLLFASWTKYSHSKLFMNASLWLAKLQ